jgi:hypothetical protein
MNHAFHSATDDALLHAIAGPENECLTWLGPAKFALEK